MVSDLVLVKDLPEIIKESVEAYVGCLAGAIMKDEYLGYIRKAGFRNVEIAGQSKYPVEAMANEVTAQIVNNNPGIKQRDLQSVEDSVASIKVLAKKFF